MEYFNELLSTLNEMSPYLLLGFLISGLLHVYVPKSLYSRFLQKKGFGSVLRAAILGIPLPLCSCGVIPTAVSLRKEGASEGATVSFLVATPQTGIDSILATYSLLGFTFAIVRPIAAFLVAIFGGFIVDLFPEKSLLAKNNISNIKEKESINSHKIDYSHVKLSENKQSKYAMQNSNIPLTGAKKTEVDSNCGCGCGCSHEGKEQKKSFKAALRYGFVYMMQDFGKWLVIGLLIAAAITAFIPDSLFSTFKDYYFLNLLLILIISAPMYVCATGSIPIALSLIMKGVSPGAAFVLLMAGPATNVASLIILRREIGDRKTVIYLISIIIGAILFAMIIDFVLPQQWFNGIESLSCLEHNHTGCSEHHHHDHDHDHALCTHGPIWWQTTTSVIFIVLFVNAMVLKWKNRRK